LILPEASNWLISKRQDCRAAKDGTEFQPIISFPLQRGGECVNDSICGTEYVRILN
jgi:hypothetical protein